MDDVSQLLREWNLVEHYRVPFSSKDPHIAYNAGRNGAGAPMYEEAQGSPYDVTEEIEPTKLDYPAREFEPVVEDTEKAKTEEVEQVSSYILKDTHKEKIKRTIETMEKSIEMVKEIPEIIKGTIEMTEETDGETHKEANHQNIMSDNNYRNADKRASLIPLSCSPSANSNQVMNSRPEHDKIAEIVEIAPRPSPTKMAIEALTTLELEVKLAIEALTALELEAKMTRESPLSLVTWPYDRRQGCRGEHLHNLSDSETSTSTTSTETKTTRKSASSSLYLETSSTSGSETQAGGKRKAKNSSSFLQKVAMYTKT